MADKIEEKALALASEWERRFVTPSESARRRALVEIFTMLVTEQEAHEADKQAFSDAVEDALPWMVPGKCTSMAQRDRLRRFIIKKPDPLVETLNALWGDGGTKFHPEAGDHLRQALAARGLGVARIGEVVEANNAPL